ncbi:hypothetical protein GUJ93_ZPchr0004g40179 [Zizania palustris]|uniref:Uncharacterized protein n=1 Tax=Zizania palustris TaxID=103762 RepID=A0A8J5RYZ6_ZIZPA|nr:hypothetical protein GUJ93_ZPchr0004g40179 [Zizania palustris]
MGSQLRNRPLLLNHVEDIMHNRNHGLMLLNNNPSSSGSRISQWKRSVWSCLQYLTLVAAVVIRLLSQISRQKSWALPQIVYPYKLQCKPVQHLIPANPSATPDLANVAPGENAVKPPSRQITIVYQDVAAAGWFKLHQNKQQALTKQAPARDWQPAA